jgi:hypothetical protein
VPSQRRFDLWQASQAFGRRLRLRLLKESGGPSAGMAQRGDLERRMVACLVSAVIPLNNHLVSPTRAAGPVPVNFSASSPAGKLLTAGPVSSFLSFSFHLTIYSLFQRMGPAYGYLTSRSLSTPSCGPPLPLICPRQCPRARATDRRPWHRVHRAMRSTITHHTIAKACRPAVRPVRPLQVHMRTSVSLARFVQYALTLAPPR